MTKAGPVIAPSAAAACVSRLRSADPWARQVATQLSDLNVAETPALVIDRHGAIAVASQVIRSTPFSHVSPYLLRRIARNVRGFYWDRPLLVAPNIYQVADDNQLDQEDFAKWVTLRTVLWGAYIGAAPWLQDAMLEGELEVMVVLSEATTLLTDQLGPAELSSVNWIRRHLPPDGTLVEMYPNLAPLRATALRFLTAIGLPENPHLVGTLLSSRESFPSMVELENPDAWQH